MQERYLNATYDSTFFGIFRILSQISQIMPLSEDLLFLFQVLLITFEILAVPKCGKIAKRQSLLSD